MGPVQSGLGQICDRQPTALDGISPAVNFRAASQLAVLPIHPATVREGQCLWESDAQRYHSVSYPSTIVYSLPHKSNLERNGLARVANTGHISPFLINARRIGDLGRRRGVARVNMAGLTAARSCLNEVDPNRLEYNTLSQKAILLVLHLLLRRDPELMFTFATSAYIVKPKPKQQPVNPSGAKEPEGGNQGETKIMEFLVGD